MTTLVNGPLLLLVQGIAKLFSYKWVAWAAGVGIALFAVKAALQTVIGLFGVTGLIGAADASGVAVTRVLGAEGILGAVSTLSIRVGILKNAFLGLGAADVLSALGALSATLAPILAGIATIAGVGWLVNQGVTNSSNADIGYANRKFYQLQSIGKYGAQQAPSLPRKPLRWRTTVLFLHKQRRL